MPDLLVPSVHATVQAAVNSGAMGNGVNIRVQAPGYVSVAEDWTSFRNFTGVTLQFETAQTCNVATFQPGTLTIEGGNLGVIKPTACQSVDMRRGKSLTVNNATLNGTLTSAYFTDAGVAGGTRTVILNDCALVGTAGGAGTDWLYPGVGLTNAWAGTWTGCTFTGGKSIINSINGAGYITLRKCNISSVYDGFDINGGALGFKVYESLIDCAHYCVHLQAVSACSVTFGGNTMVAGTKEIRISGGSVLSWTHRNNWHAVIDGLGPTNWDHNGYTTLASGNGGTSAVVTGAPLFVGGGNYHTQATSTLRNAGTDIGETLDLDGNPIPSGSAPDIGCYEAQYVDCGVSTVTASDSLTLTVTFVASGGGTQAPLEAHAEDRANWNLTLAGDATMKALTSERISAYVYRLRTTHRSRPGATITVDASAVHTDAGGHCNDPGTGTCVAVSDAAAQTIPEFPVTVGPADLVGEVIP